ncbi:MAG: hypothetical protein ACHBN1_26110 [Heteroscytonema crispum UTEX LB 1556]
MPETKIQGKFYPLKNSEWVDCCKQLTKSQLSVLYYLRSLDPYSNGIKVRASKISDELGISKRAVNAAIAILNERGYINLEDVEYSIKILSGGCLCDSSSTDTKVGNSHPTQAENFPPKQRISHLKPETPTQQEFQNYNILKINKNIKNTTEKEGSVKNDFEKEFSELFAKYESRLALYTIRSKCYVNDELVNNPKLEKIKSAIAHIPITKIETGIRAFLAWIKNAKNVRDPYKALHEAILRGWEV